MSGSNVEIGSEFQYRTQRFKINLFCNIWGIEKRKRKHQTTEWQSDRIQQWSNIGSIAVMENEKDIDLRET